MKNKKLIAFVIAILGASSLTEIIGGGRGGGHGGGGRGGGRGGRGGGRGRGAGRGRNRSRSRSHSRNRGNGLGGYGYGGIGAGWLGWNALLLTGWVVAMNGPYGQSFHNQTNNTYIYYNEESGNWYDSSTGQVTQPPFAQQR